MISGSAHVGKVCRTEKTGKMKVKSYRDISVTQEAC